MHTSFTASRIISFGSKSIQKASRRKYKAKKTLLGEKNFHWRKMLFVVVRNVWKTPLYSQTTRLTESCKKLLMQLENIQFRMFFRMYYNYLILFHWFQTITRNWRQKIVTFSFWFPNTIIFYRPESWW